MARDYASRQFLEKVRRSLEHGDVASALRFLEQALARRQRGRPRGSGRNDTLALERMADLLICGKAKTPTDAARQVGGPVNSCAAVVSRLVRKYRVNRACLESEARERRGRMNREVREIQAEIDHLRSTDFAGMSIDPFRGFLASARDMNAMLAKIQKERAAMDAVLERSPFHKLAMQGPYPGIPYDAVRIAMLRSQLAGGQGGMRELREYRDHGGSLEDFTPSELAHIQSGLQREAVSALSESAPGAPRKQ